MTATPPPVAAVAVTWYAQVVSQGDAQATLQAQANFIRHFVGRLFQDLDAGTLTGARSAHFHRLVNEVRFRLVGAAPMTDLVSEVERRLQHAITTGLISGFRSDPEGPWETPDSAYGTDVPNVPPAFTQFLESISRATVAILNTSADFRVPEQVLWNWLHLVHNPMTGLERHLVEVAPHTAVHRL